MRIKIRSVTLLRNRATEILFSKFPIAVTGLQGEATPALLLLKFA